MIHLNDECENYRGLVSVIIPAYNAEKTIDKAIQSAVDQTYRNIEVIVIDDCSTDKTIEKVIFCLQKDDRIKLLKNNINIGVSESRNRGVKKARGEWIAFLDSDDIWAREKLERQIKEMENDNCSICFTGSGFIRDDGKRYSFVLKVPEKITYNDLLKQNLISCSSVIIRKQTAVRYPMRNDPMIHEDLAVWLKVLQEEPYAVGINEPLLFYRISKSGKSGHKWKSAMMQWKTYKVVGLQPQKAIVCFFIYTLRGIRKYSTILGSVKPKMQRR